MEPEATEKETKTRNPEDAAEGLVSLQTDVSGVYSEALPTSRWRCSVRPWKSSQLGLLESWKGGNGA